MIINKVALMLLQLIITELMTVMHGELLEAPLSSTTHTQLKWSAHLL